MFLVVEADWYDFTCKQLRVSVFILLKASAAGNRLKLSKVIINQPITRSGHSLFTYTHAHSSTHARMHT